jgi:hypothetical protein
VVDDVAGVGRVRGDGAAVLLGVFRFELAVGSSRTGVTGSTSVTGSVVHALVLVARDLVGGVEYSVW